MPTSSSIEAAIDAKKLSLPKVKDANGADQQIKSEEK